MGKNEGKVRKKGGERERERGGRRGRTLSFTS
jgi:hypothetical protein